MPSPRIRRYAGLAVAAVVAVAVCLLAASWQWQTYLENRALNDRVRAAADAPAAAVDALLRPGQPATAEAAYAQVEVRGTYDAERALVVRLRPRDGQTGSHSLVPLVTADGTALLVDRGWYADDALRTQPPPAPPPGPVTVRARLALPDTDEGTGGDPATGAVRYVDVEALRGAYPYDIYGAYGQLVTEDPRPATAPLPTEEPTFTEVLHLAYTVQWGLFALLAVGGALWLARSDARSSRRQAATASTSTGST